MVSTHGFGPCGQSSNLWGATKFLLSLYSMEHLINYPCGLGDCLMLTPALREYYKTYNIKLSVAILKKFCFIRTCPVKYLANEM